MEFMEDQQLIIQQLKEMLRKNERELQDKNRELEDTVAKFQKFKLQSKAKISQLTNQLKEKEKIQEASSSENIPASTGADSSEQKNRGKVIMLKKQLDDAKQMYEKMEKDLVTEKEALQNAVAELQVQLKEKDEIILSKKALVTISSEVPRNDKERESGNVQEMYAQMVYKDSKIMELNELVSEKERKIMDLQELVKEKEEVLQTRNRAIQLLTEDLNRKGKSVSDQLDTTRDEMRLMQEDFIAKESKWNESKEELGNEMRTMKENFDSLLNDKSKEIAALQVTVQNLETVRFDLAARNAELQEKVVRIQDDFSKYRNDAESEKAQMEALRKALVDTESQMDAKVLKARVKERTKLKALERQLEELKSGDQTQLAALQQKIAELEEEKGSLQLKLLGFEENSSSQESDGKEGSPHGFESDLLVEKMRNEITTLESKVEDQRIKLEDRQNELLQIKESYDQKELECSELKSLVQELQKTEEEICGKMDTLHSLLNVKDTKINEMIAMLSKYEEEKVSFEMKIIELEEQKDMFENKEKEFLQEKKCWQDTLEKEKQALVYVQKEKEEALAELEETKITCKTVEEGNFKLQNTLSNLQDGCDQLAQKNITLQEELHLKNNETEKQSREITNLKQQLDHIEAEFTREKDNFKYALEQKDYKERQLTAFFNQYSIADISDLQSKWKENLDLLNDLENTLETETISKSLQIKELEHMLETKEISYKEEISKLREIIKDAESEKCCLEALISEKDILISNFQKNSNEKESYLLDSIKEKEKVIVDLSSEVNELKNFREQAAKYSEENKVMGLELASLRKNLDECELNIANLKGQLSKSNKSNEKIQQDLLELNSQKEYAAMQLEAEVKQHKDAINQMNKKLQGIQSCLDNAGTAPTEDNDTLSLEEKLSVLVLERNNYKLQLNELQNELSIVTEQKKELENKLSTYKTEVSVLQEAHEKYEKEIKNYKEQMALSECIAEKYESKINALSKILEEKEEEISVLTEKLMSSECQLEANNSELQKLASELNDLSQRYKEAVTCNEEIEREILARVSEINNSHRVNEQLQAEIKLLQSNNNKLQIELEKAVQDAETLKETLVKTEKLYNSTHETLVNKETEIADLKHLQKQFDNLDSNLYEANVKISKLEMELKTKAEYLQDIEQRLQENVLAICSQERAPGEAVHEEEQKIQVDQWLQQMEQNNLDKATFYGKMIENGIQKFIFMNGMLTNELTTANDMIATLKSQHESEMNSLTRLLEKETEYAAHLKQDVENMKFGRTEMVENFNTAIQALQDKIQTFEIEKIELLKEITTYEQVNSSLSEEVEKMKKDENNYKDSIMKLEEKISEYSEQVNEMTKKCQDLSKELSDSFALHARLEFVNLEMEKLKDLAEEERLKHLEEKKSNEKIIEEYKVTLEQFQKENVEWKEKTAVINTELAKCKSYLQQQKIEIQELLSQLKEKDDNILMLEAQSAEVNRALKGGQAEVERLQFFENEYHAAITQLRNTEDSLKEKEIAIENIIKENESIISSKEKLEAEVLVLTEQLKETQETFGKQKVALQEHIKESCNKLADLDTKLSESHHIVSTLENALQEKELLLSARDDENKGLLSKLEMLEDLHSAMESDFEKLKSEISNERKENGTLKEYIEKMEEEKLKLVDHIHTLEKEISSSQSKLVELKDIIAKCESLESELSKSKEHILLLESDSTDKVQQLSTALEKANIHIHEQESKISVLEGSLENALKLKQETEGQNKSLEEEINSLRSNSIKITEEREKEYHDLRIKLKEMQTSNEDLQQQTEKLQLSEKEMKTLVAELEENLKDSSSKTTLLSTQLQEVEERLSRYKDVIERQEKDLKRQIENNEQLNSQHMEISEEMRILQNKYQEVVNLNHLLEEQIGTLQLTSKEQDEKYNASVSEYESEINSLRISLEKSGKTLTDLQMQCSELQAANSTLTESIKCLQDEKDPTCERQNVLHELQNSNNALEYEIQSLRGEFCKIEEERNHLVSCLSEMSRKVQCLEQRTMMYSDEKTSLLEKIENLKTINENLQKDKNFKVSSLEAELERLSAESNDLQEKLNVGNNQQFSDLEVEISEYKDKIAYLETKLRSCEMTIEALSNENDSRKDVDEELQKVHELYKKVNNEKESLQNKVSELENIIQNKHAEHNELSEKYKELLGTNESLSSDLQKLHLDCQSLENENKLLKEDIERTRNENSKEHRPESDAKTVTNVIFPETAPQLEKEMVQQKENTSDMAQKLLKENEAMKNSLDVQKIKLEKMFAKLKAFKEKNDHLQEENKIANTKLSCIEKEKELLESEITEKTELLRRLTSEGEKSTSLYQRDISERESIITRLKEENKLLSTKYQQIEMDLHECSKSREVISISLDKKNKELDDLLVRLQQMEKVQASLEEQLSNYNRQCNQLHYEKDCVQREVEDMKGQMEMLSSDNETFQTLLENMQKSKAALETELLKQREQHAKSLKEAQNKHLQDVEKLKNALHQSEQTVSALQDQCRSFEEKCATSDEHLQSSSVELVDKEKENAFLREQNTSLSNELTRVLHELNSLRSFSGWESDVTDTESNRKDAENKKETQNEKLLASLKESELKLQQKVNMLEYELQQQGNEYQLKLQDLERNALELHFQLNEMVTKNESLSEMLVDREKQWSEEINRWQQKESSLQLQIRNLENQLQELIAHPAVVQKDESRRTLEGSALQDTKSDSIMDGERVDQLKQELQQVMYALHSQSLRSENLSQEVNKLIEERNALQHQLSYYMNMARSKGREQYQRATENEGIVKPLSENTASTAQESAEQNVNSWPNTVSPNEELNSRAETRLVNVQLELENLYQRIQKSEEANNELQQMNESLDKELRAERERRKLVEEELTFAKDEAILNLPKPLNNEYRLLIDEDEPQMFPETNYSISRRVKTHAYRFQHWLRRKRNHCYRLFRRMPGLQILFYIYILIIHVWFLICLF